MSNIFNTEQRLLLGKREDVAGTSEELQSTDGDVRVRDLELSSLAVEFDDESSKYLTGDHTRDHSIAGVARAGIDFSIKFAEGEFNYSEPDPSGDPGVYDLDEAKLPYAKYLEGAGLVVTTVNPTDEDTEDGYWEITPNITADSNTMSMALYDIQTGNTPHGIEYKIAGAMGGLTIESEAAGKPFMMNYSFQGKVDSVNDVTGSNIPEFSDDDVLKTLADKMLNTDIRITEKDVYGNDIGASPIDFCVNTFSMDLGSNIVEIPCQSDNFGIKHFTITERDERFSFSPLLTSLDEWDFWKALTDEKTYSFEVIVYKDSTKTDIALKIEVPVGQFITLDGSDDNGFRRLDATFRSLRNWQGNDKDEKQAVYKITIGGKNNKL